MCSFFGPDHMNHEVFDITGRLAYLSLPAADAPDSVQQKAVERLGRELGIDISLFDRHRRPIASTGEPIAPSPRMAPSGSWHRVHGGPAWALDLPDGRWLVVDLGRRGAHQPLLNLAIFLGIVALGVGLCAYPLVRRLTRRLERLQKGVERIGSGDFAARVEVEGRDEVAGLAASFNEAAEKSESCSALTGWCLPMPRTNCAPRFRASGLASKCWRTGAIRLEGRHCGTTLPSWIR